MSSASTQSESSTRLQYFKVRTAIIELPGPGSTFDFTISDFGGDTPKAAIVILPWTLSTADESNRAGASLSIGFTDGTTDYCVAVGSVDNVSTTDTVRHIVQGRIAELIEGNPPDINVEWFTNTFLENGIRLEITGSYGSTQNAILILIGGSECEAKTGDFTPAASGSQAITGVGFAPDAVCMLSVGNAKQAYQTLQDNAILSFGWASESGSSITQSGVAYYMADNKTSGVDTDNGCLISNADIPGQIQTTVDWDLTVTSLDSDGWTHTVGGSGASSDAVCYLALATGGASDSDQQSFFQPCIRRPVAR